MSAIEDREECRSQTKRDLEELICQLLGGREVERLYYGDGQEDSIGPSNDLERAAAIVEAMVYEFGMAEEIGFVRIDRRYPLAGETADRCHQAVRRLSKPSVSACSGYSQSIERSSIGSLRHSSSATGFLSMSCSDS